MSCPVTWGAELLCAGFFRTGMARAFAMDRQMEQQLPLPPETLATSLDMALKGRAKTVSMAVTTQAFRSLEPFSAARKGAQIRSLTAMAGNMTEPVTEIRKGSATTGHRADKRLFAGMDAPMYTQALGLPEGPGTAVKGADKSRTGRLLTCTRSSFCCQRRPCGGPGMSCQPGYIWRWNTHRQANPQRTQKKAPSETGCLPACSALPKALSGFGQPASTLVFNS